MMMAMINLFNFFLSVVTPAAPETPLTPEMIPGYEGTFLKMFLTLLALVVGIFLMIWTLRRMSQGKWGKNQSGRSIRIVERQPLSPKTMLYVIEIGGKQTVIAESQLEVRPLLTLDEVIDKE